jgi:hypothetical protein
MGQSGLSKATFPSSAVAKDFFALLRKAKTQEWQAIASQTPEKGALISADRIDTNVSSIREQYIVPFERLLGIEQLTRSDIALLLNCNVGVTPF